MMLPTNIDFVIRHVGVLHLPIIIATTDRSMVGESLLSQELYRGEFHNTAEEALARMQEIWDTLGTPEIKKFREDMACA